jgi:hypothetical protein
MVAVIESVPCIARLRINRKRIIPSIRISFLKDSGGICPGGGIL